MNKKGLLISFEGIDGSGKTTQLKLLYNELMSRGIDTIKTREPGGTIPGERIRQLLSDRQLEIQPDTELILFFASRVQLIKERIIPALNQNKIILCDRFQDATVAYQGYGRGISMDMITIFEKAFTFLMKPDRTFLLDCPYAAAKKRLNRRSNATRIELMDEAFFNRVREGYLTIAEAEPDRMVVIDANDDISAIHKRIKDNFFSFLERKY